MILDFSIFCQKKEFSVFKSTCPKFYFLKRSPSNVYKTIPNTQLKIFRKKSQFFKTYFSENFQSKSRAWARAFKCELLSLVWPRKYSKTFEHTLYHKQMSGAFRKKEQYK